MEQAQEINKEVRFWQRMNQEDRMDLLDVMVEAEEVGLDPKMVLLKALDETRQSRGNG